MKRTLNEVFNINKKHFAMNKLFNFCLVFGSLLAWASIELFFNKDIAWGLGFGIAALLFIVPSAIFTPCCYIFDREGISLCYIFLPVERYLWNDIYAIEVEDKKIGLASKASIFDLFYASVFAIKGSNVGEFRFYMSGHIRKSFRTKYLLEKYWDGTITGYFFDDAKKWINKKNLKRQAQIKAHLTDEIVTKERHIRAEIRTWIEPFIAKAKQYNIEIKTKYVYITKEFTEFNSRPKEGYTYTLTAEIAQFDETNVNRILVIAVDLLYVRLGKTSYRGVKNKHAKEEIELAFSDAIENLKI